LWKIFLSFFFGQFTLSIFCHSIYGFSGWPSEPSNFSYAKSFSLVYFIN
jgi:hypothetical protein